MKIRLHFIGKCKSGPEVEIFDRYFSRLRKVGRSINIFPVDVIEYDERKFFSKNRDLKFSSRTSSDKITNILLDETGKNISSNSFALLLNNFKDQGVSELSFFVGGAQGFPKELKADFARVISFGKMVWPHMFARVMLIEQLYRASTIISGLPYHKS